MGGRRGRWARLDGAPRQRWQSHIGRQFSVPVTISDTGTCIFLVEVCEDGSHGARLCYSNFLLGNGK